MVRHVGPAVPLERQLVALVDEHLDARCRQSRARDRVAVERERDAGGEGEHVRAHARELLVRHGHDLDAARLQQLRERHGKQRRIGDDEIGSPAVRAARAGA